MAQIPTPALDELLADLRALVECESPSTDPAAVARSADLVARLGEARLGVPPERIDIDGCAHLRWRFGTSTRVVLLCHHDTVWPLGTLDRIPFSVSDGVLRGPGCFDMLAGLVQALHALAALPSRDGVTLLVTGDEEIGSPTSRALIEETVAGAAAVLVPEASADGGAFKVARKGASMWDVTVRGRAAHAGLEPEKGANATVELAHVVLAVAALGDATAETTVVPTTATSGTSANTVPGEARLSVDSRAWTIAEQERVDAAIRALQPTLPGVRLEITGGINRPPLEEASSEALFARARALAAELGLPTPTAARVGGASDGNFAAGMGVPTLDGLGAVGGGAHAEDEHLLVDRLIDRTVLLGALVEDLLEEA